MLLARSPIVSPSPMLMRRRRSSIPLWLRLVQEAEAAAAAAGASLWYVPPAGYADRSVNGPFVGSDGSGGNPALGSGVAGWLTDRRAGGVSAINLNGDPGFDNPGYWTPYGAAPGWAVSGGLAQVTAPAAGARWLSRPSAIAAGSTYIITGDATVTAGSFGVDIGGTPADITTSGPFVRITTAAITTFQLIARAGFVGSVDNLRWSVIPGNHASQSTSGNRPVFVPAPGADAAFLGPDLLGGAGAFDSLAGWSATGTSISLESGRLKITGAGQPSYVRYNVQTVIGRTYRIRFFAEISTSSAGTNAIRAAGPGGSWTTANITPANGLVLRDVVVTAASTQTTVEIVVYGAAETVAYVDDFTIREVPAGADAGFGALSFDGSNDQLLTSLATPATSTLILAVQAGALANMAPFGTGDNADTNVVVLKFRSNGEIWSRRNNGSTSEIVTLTSAYSANEQFVISSEFDTDRQRVFKNGTQIGAQVFSGGFTAGSGSLRLGAIVNGFESFNGRIVGAALIPSANSAARVPIERLFAYMAGANYTG